MKLALIAALAGVVACKTKDQENYMTNLDWTADVFDVLKEHGYDCIKSCGNDKWCIAKCALKDNEVNELY